MRAWSVSDKWYEIQVAVLAIGRGQAKALGFHEFQAWGADLEFTDLRATQVRCPISIEGRPRVLTVPDSLPYGFRWNNETMDDHYPGWYDCWLVEKI